MPTLPATYSDFRGGLNTQDAPYVLETGQARDLSNVTGSLAGAIYKRNGLVTFASLPNVFHSLVRCEQTSPILLVAGGAGSLYSITAAGVVTSVKSGLTSGVPWEFVSANVIGSQGPLYGINGTDPPQQFNGTTMANWVKKAGTGRDPPNGKYCVYTENQVYIAGEAANPSRVYWSAINDPTDWDQASLTGAGFKDFDPSDGQVITALGRVGPYVLVAKPRKLWVITDVASAFVRRVSQTIGCVSHRSMQEGQAGTYFLAEDRGVYLTDGTRITSVSKRIDPTLKALPTTKVAQAAGAYVNNHYYLSAPLLGGAVNDTTLDYDENLQSWWKHSVGSNQFALWHPNGVAGLYSAKSTAQILDNCFVPSVFVDNGQPVTWVWKGPWQSPSFFRRALFPTPYYRKRLRQVRLEGNGTVDFSIARDFANLESLVRANIFGTTGPSDAWGGAGFWGGDGVWGGDLQVRHARYDSLGVANAFSVVLGATSISQDFIDNYTLVLTDRKDAVVA